VTRLADVCVTAVADAFRGDGEILANPIGPFPLLGGRLARASFEPALGITDGEARLVDDEGNLEGPATYRMMLEITWSGRRHVMMGASQLDRFGNQNIACIGEPARPRVQLLGFRGGPGNTINDVTSYWVPGHSPKVFVEEVDVVTGIGYDRSATLGTAGRFHEIRHIVTNLCVLDFLTDDRSMRLRSRHPGVTAGQVRDATGFAVAGVDDAPETRLPSDEEMGILERLDPDGSRYDEVPDP
jgi:hypothetical protein